MVLVGEWRNSYIVLVGKPKGKIPFGWGGILLKCMDRIYVVRDRDQWRDVVTTIMNRGCFRTFGGFLD